MNEYKMPIREQNSNKGTFGKVLNFAGSKNYIGAAYLSTVSILKVGGGFAALATEKDIIRSVSTLLPEAVYLSRKEGLEQIEDFSVVLIGCGLGRSKWSEKLFKYVLNNLQKCNNHNITNPLTKTHPNPPYLGREKALVIDADGLNILAGLSNNSKTLTPHPGPLLKERELKGSHPCPLSSRRGEEGLVSAPAESFLKERKSATIITPHPLEAARLLGVQLEEILNDLEGSAKKLCEKYNCITVLKTHRTIICDANKIFINQHGNSALAKAGSGDVLAGIIAGLLASTKLTPFEAAKLGVYLHSRAGEIASEELTEYSVLASDLPNYLPKAIKEIL